MFTKTSLFATLLSLWKSISEAAASEKHRHPPEPPWQHLLVILLTSHRLLDPPVPQHHPALDPAEPCLLLSCLLSTQGAQCSHVPGTKQSYKPHPVPGLGLRIVIADCNISVCPAADTCLLTLINRNFMSPGDGCEYTKKMLQVL